jgi:hypothetical protein
LTPPPNRRVKGCMAKETVYIVQSYKAGRGKSLKAEQ